ncbi:hypothetical protein [Agromyces badenianii]|uniref:hypothetical protein n=1 Tax=Agromyces badenianii TaxID=2080742 RepID=UPI000D59299A|nr:hypothetical protein [Agromyces badenianii]PWC03121.1 hypothetical protein DCE94_12685 [Agromyces badenianii]
MSAGERNGSAPERNGSGDGIGERLAASADAAAPRPIDVDAVLSASRARRRSRRTAIVGGAAAAVIVLGAGGIVVSAGLGGLGPGVSTTAGDASLSESPAAGTVPESATGDALGLKLAAPERVNLCGAPIAAATDAAMVPLAVTVTTPATVGAGASVDALVTVTNTGDAPVGGELRLAPALTVAEAGIAVWHSSGDAAPESRAIELAPGASIELTGTFETRRCSADDELGPALPADLPALSPGAYEVSAVVMFSEAPQGSTGHLISRPAPIVVG